MAITQEQINIAKLRFESDVANNASLDDIEATRDEYFLLKQQYDSSLQTDVLIEYAATPEATVKSVDSINTSESEAATADKYADASNLAPTDNSSNDIEDARFKSIVALDDTSYSNVERARFARHTKPTSTPARVMSATPSFNGAFDHRVKLAVPPSYLIGLAAGPGNIITKLGGIVFPYTPSIQQETSANYTAVNTVHSNFTQYFYKNSAAGSISLSAKFTVQNEQDAGIYLSTVHLLRALTKMRTGNDSNSGSPPPVCRLMAYGEFGLENTPVVINTFKLDYPDNVDYFDFSKSQVPVLTTITMTLFPIYSRNEQLKFSVTQWLTGDMRKQGYL